MGANDYLHEYNSFQAFEPDKDTKAFIYQQVHDLELELSGYADVSVIVERMEETEVESGDLVSTKFAVSFTVDPEGAKLTVRAESKDVIAACMEAKRVLKSKLEKVIPTSSEERASTIESIMSGNGYLH